jgi:hypothetical protein
MILMFSFLLKNDGKMAVPVIISLLNTNRLVQRFDCVFTNYFCHLWPHVIRLGWDILGYLSSMRRLGWVKGWCLVEIPLRISV